MCTSQLFLLLLFTSFASLHPTEPPSQHNTTEAEGRAKRCGKAWCKPGGCECQKCDCHLPRCMETPAECCETLSPDYYNFYEEILPGTSLGTSNTSSTTPSEPDVPPLPTTPDDYRDLRRFFTPRKTHLRIGTPHITLFPPNHPRPSLKWEVTLLLPSTHRYLAGGTFVTPLHHPFKPSNPPPEVTLFPPTTTLQPSTSTPTPRWDIRLFSPHPFTLHHPFTIHPLTPNHPGSSPPELCLKTDILFIKKHVVCCDTSAPTKTRGKRRWTKRRRPIRRKKKLRKVTRKVTQRASKKPRRKRTSRRKVKRTQWKRKGTTKIRALGKKMKKSRISVGKKSGKKITTKRGQKSTKNKKTKKSDLKKKKLL